MRSILIPPSSYSQSDHQDFLSMCQILQSVLYICSRLLPVPTCSLGIHVTTSKLEINKGSAVKLVPPAPVLSPPSSSFCRQPEWLDPVHPLRDTFCARTHTHSYNVFWKQKKSLSFSSWKPFSAFSLQTVEPCVGSPTSPPDLSAPDNPLLNWNLSCHRAFAYAVSSAWVMSPQICTF